MLTTVTSLARKWFLAISLALIAGPVVAGPTENRMTAVAFMEMIHQGPRKIDEAFARYVGPRYIQHHPGIADGIEAAASWLKETLKDSPDKPRHFEVLRAVAGDDYAAVHSHSYAGDDPGVALVDWFRFDESGKIVEHWDVVEKVPDQVTATKMFGRASP